MRVGEKKDVGMGRTQEGRGQKGKNKKLEEKVVDQWGNFPTHLLLVLAFDTIRHTKLIIALFIP